MKENDVPYQYKRSTIKNNRYIIEYQLVSFEYTSKCLNFTNVDIDIDLSKYEPTIFAAVSYTLSLSWWIDK